MMDHVSPGSSCMIVPSPIIIAMFACLMMSACVSVPRDDFTEAQQAEAAIEGLRGVRVWADATRAEFEATGIGPPTDAMGGPIDILALSGGGAAGAFGAGLLSGWTEAGTRPEFDLVSGVSTGALIAPFAFLGYSYDPIITDLYTSGVAEAVGQRRGIVGILRTNSVADAAPLRRLIEGYAGPDLLDAVAREHRRGRRLFVVTTNLDAQRPVLWDMGAIAASGHPDALRLFRDVLIASASVPAILPPVLVEVEAGADGFSEMHVDGSTTIPVFTLPQAFLGTALVADVPAGTEVNLYVVVNSVLAPEFEVVENATLGITGRALATSLKAQALGVLLSTQAAADRLNIDLHVASIDQDVPYDAGDPFDTGYMRALFDVGRQRVEAGADPRWDINPFETGWEFAQVAYDAALGDGASPQALQAAGTP